MNAIGIDVSKGKSTVAVIRPFGEIVKKPFDVMHTSKDLNDLADFILSLEGESRVVLEHTDKYSAPIAEYLCNAGIFVSVVNAKLIYNYGNDTIRRDKTDKVDALKIASYCLDKWVKLSPYTPENEHRKILKAYNRQLSEYTKIKTMLKTISSRFSIKPFPVQTSCFQALQGSLTVTKNGLILSPIFGIASALLHFPRKLSQRSIKSGAAKKVITFPFRKQKIFMLRPQVIS